MAGADMRNDMFANEMIAELVGIRPNAECIEPSRQIVLECYNLFWLRDGPVLIAIIAHHIRNGAARLAVK